MPMEEVVVSGMGVITSLGSSVNELWFNLLEKKCAAWYWEDLEREGFRTSMACRIKDSTIPEDETRGQRVALLAVQQAMDQAQITDFDSMGIYVGTTMGESVAFENAAKGKNLILERTTGGVFAKAIQEHYDTTGPTAVFGTACAAGNYAIGAAARAVRSGRVKAAIAGGVEPFSRIAMVGFSRSRAMTPDFCRPFDADRKGMQLSEGAGFLILESLENALNRNITPLAVIGELGLSCDAHHPTKPNEDGVQIAQAMQNAMIASGVSAQKVSWVCAHGSGTLASDYAEAKGIAQVFGDKLVWVSGIKGALGHSLGAATAIEAVICVKSLLTKTIPPTVNLETLGPDLKIKVAKDPVHLQQMDWVLNCGYAFGGINSALLIGKI